MLALHDTATGSARPLELRTPGKVALYACGPTVYDAPHLGHGRSTLVFDVLRRYLAFTGLEVTHVSNVTDIDDKIIERAAARGITERELAAEAEAQWWEAMGALDVLRPDATPHATAFVDRMVALIAELVDGGVAYETGDGVYLSVAHVDGYGLLAQQSLRSLRAGARVATDEDKRSPLDFVLWKKAKPGEPTWPSPWGPGRPGWHTECVVMSLDLLGEGFELHGGGMDLMFPHHENERAQAVADGRRFARHWVHHGFVTSSGEKMSKSEGNFATLADLLAAHDPRSYRLLVLRSHYRSPIEVTDEIVGEADASLDRLDRVARRFGVPDALADGPVVDPTARDAPRGPDAVVGGPVDPAVVGRFRAAMDNDLDTPAALALVFDTAREANAAADAGDGDRGADLARTAVLLCAAVGLRVGWAGADADAGGVDEESAAWVVERDEARAARHWARADELRSRLEAAGWVVEDTPDGTSIRRG